MSTNKKPRKPTLKQQLTAEGIAQGKSPLQAAMDAGYTESSARTMLYKPSENSALWNTIEQRRKELITKAQVHTDEITGSLVEIMQGSIADLLPHSKALRQAKRKGLDKIIKKVSIRYKKVGDRTLPDGTKEPIIKEEVDIEVYSRLDAISQLRDNFGMKQEPRSNTYEETRRLEVEKHIDRIAEADNCNRTEAAKRLAQALGKDSPLLTTVNKYIH